MKKYLIISLLIFSAGCSFDLCSNDTEEVNGKCVFKEQIKCEDKGGIYFQGNWGAARCEFPPTNQK